MPTSNGARRSERVSFAIPITISGKDADNRPFKEVSLTLVVSKNGGLIITFHKLVKGSQIVIENPALSRTGTARVVWVSQGRSPDIPFEAGVELDGASYLWPVEFPPAAERGNLPNRTNGDTAGLEKPEEPQPTIAADPPRVQPMAAESAPRPSAWEPKIPSTVIASAKHTLDVTPAAMPRESKVLDFPSTRAGSFPQVQGTAALAKPSLPPEQIASVLEEALARFVKQIDEMAAERLKLFDNKLAAVADEIYLQVQARLDESGNRLEEKILVSIGQRGGTLGEHLQALGTGAQDLMAKFEQLKQNGRPEHDRIQKDIRNAGEQALQSALELEKRLQRELESRRLPSASGDAEAHPGRCIGERGGLQ